MSTLALLLTQFVNALSQSALLFFLGVGLTLIFGLMRIVNFAHGALYMLGAFVGYSLASRSGPPERAVSSRSRTAATATARTASSRRCAGRHGRGPRAPSSARRDAGSQAASPSS